MGVFTKLREQLELTEGNETAYLGLIVQNPADKDIRFVKAENVEFHDSVAVMEITTGGSTDFIHAGQCRSVGMHYVEGSFVKYLQREIPDMWNGFPSEAKEAMINKEAEALSE